MKAEKIMTLIDSNREPSRYFRVISDGHRGFYDETIVEIVDSGKNITKIISALEENGMEWQFAYCDIFPELKRNGKYHLHIPVGEYFYKVTKNGIHTI